MSSTLLPVGLGIAAVLVASRALASRTGLPYPVFLLVAGSIVGFIPGVPVIHLQPDVVFLGFLPPLVYHAGVVTSPRELRANALPIGLSALGLVLITTFTVAGVVWGAEPQLGFVAAFVLGAIIAPTDPVAATSVLNRLGGPPHITVVLEGESLVNDGIALSLFSLGLAAVATPTGAVGGIVTFAKIAGGGALFGLVVGWVAARVRRPLRDAASQIVVSLLVPYLAYLPANALGLSGVLATLVAGLVLGQRPVATLGPSGRIRAAEFWEVLVFLLESVLFVLVGLQLHQIVHGIAAISGAETAVVTAAAIGTAVAVRLLWWLAVPTLRWRPEGRLVDTGGIPWQERIVLGWGGLRGALSLAAALSIPVMAAGRPFPGRDLLQFATFCVIAFTLVGQGGTLPWLLRRLGLVGSDVQQAEHALAERRCTEAALRRLDQLVADDAVADEDADALRQIYERRLTRLRGHGEAEQPRRAQLPLRQVQARLLTVQHQVLEELHRRGEISYSVMRQVRYELDLEQAGLAEHDH